MQQNKCLSCVHAEKCVYAAYADKVLACVLHTLREDTNQPKILAKK
jgi:hypothetical protein